MASTLQMVCKLMDPDYTWPSSDEHSVVQLIQLIEDALYLDAPIALKHIQRAIASRLNGKRAPELSKLRAEEQLNSLDVKSATMLAKIGAEKGIMLSGMTRDQSLAYFSGQNLRPADAILIASDLKFMAVLTELRGAQVVDVHRHGDGQSTRSARHIEDDVDEEYLKRPWHAARAEIAIEMTEQMLPRTLIPMKPVEQEGPDPRGKW